MRADPVARAAPLYRVGVLVRHNTMLLLQEPGRILAYLVMPMALMAIEAPLYRAALRGEGTGAGTVQVVAGLLVMFSLLALSIVGHAVLNERTWGTWDRLRATPAAPVELLLGKATAALVILLAQQAVLLGFGVAVVGLRPTGPVALIAVAVAAWSVALLCCGTALAVSVRGHGQLGTACDIGGLVLSGLGGALAPLSAMPGWTRALAPVSPGYWAMAALRSAITDDTGGTLRAAAVLAALAAVTGAYATARIARGRLR